MGTGLSSLSLKSVRSTARVLAAAMAAAATRGARRRGPDEEDTDATEAERDGPALDGLESDEGESSNAGVTGVVAVVEAVVDWAIASIGQAKPVEGEGRGGGTDGDCTSKLGRKDRREGRGVQDTGGYEGRAETSGLKIKRRLWSVGRSLISLL